MLKLIADHYIFDHLVPKDREDVCYTDSEYYFSPTYFEKFNLQDSLAKHQDEIEKQIIKDTPTDSLTDGQKTVLSIYHTIKTGTIDKYKFDLSECTGEQVSYIASILAKQADIIARIRHNDFGTAKDCLIQINDDPHIYTDADQASDIYMDITLEAFGCIKDENGEWV